MPKIEIDYSKTIFYKIICKDHNVKDLYVGYTTNFTQKKYIHKQNCINESSSNYTNKLYNVIRANGGWDNWIMENIGLYKCTNHNEVVQKELDLCLALKSTLNTNISSNNLMEIKKLKKNLPKYICEYCDFECSMKCDWDRHVIRPKHLRKSNGNKPEIKLNEANFTCDCNKKYYSLSGLWKHKKICNKNNAVNVEDEKISYSEITNETILSILKQNNELQNMLIEQNKTIIELSKNNQTNSHNNHTNSHNKTFNLQVFLNETCKDAMNIMEFVDSIKLQLSDFERVGEVGFVNGISDIIIKNLKQLDITERPIHCTDKKREIMYVKDENKWEKRMIRIGKLDEPSSTLRIKT